MHPALGRNGVVGVTNLFGINIVHILERQLHRHLFAFAVVGLHLLIDIKNVFLHRLSSLVIELNQREQATLKVEGLTRHRQIKVTEEEGLVNIKFALVNPRVNYPDAQLLHQIRLTAEMINHA